jgi:hypothetical protein
MARVSVRHTAIGGAVVAMGYVLLKVNKRTGRGDA